MERYKILKTVGDGTFGTVYKAVNKSNGEVVAIKKMKKKFYNWDECLALREIKSLRKLSHQNIIKMKEVIRVNDELHLVFDYLDQNVYELIKGRSDYLPESQIRSIMYQTFLGLAYMHKQGFFHRDLKPENLMVHQEICKIADFGLAREIRSKPPYTDYVSTRWYRAPEILLRSTNYNSPADIFAMGCIMVELYNLRPLAPGNNENDQMFKFCTALGTPSPSDWAEGYRLASQMGYHFPQATAVPLRTLVPGACSEALSLLEQLLTWNPQSRPTASDCLQHPYFTNYQPILSGQPTPQAEDPTSRGNIESRGKGLPSAFRRTNSKWSQGSSRIGGGSSKGKWNIKANIPVVDKKDFVLPKLPEVAELSNFGVAKRNPPNKYMPENNAQGLSGQQREDLYLPPVVNPGSGKMLPSVYDRQPPKDFSIYNPPSNFALDRQPLREFGEKNPNNKPRDFSIDRQDYDIYGVKGQNNYSHDKNTPGERYPSGNGGLGRGFLDKLPKYNPPAFPYMNQPKKLPPVGGLSGIGSNIMGSKMQMQPRGMQKASMLPALGRHRY
ncbi:unnamed protein product [Blepharisma stoltei]|uniref:Protein kinase domain-containing protein n=1 Tax=Blepharisma stoltei TaxID=1481888 RepID=A0AAU9K9F4_9CILI|nr:unnamed protein product [Blepharisma stoltei]